MINLQKASKKFDQNAALKDVNIQVDDGECLALIGANGSGKSTLINCILGLLDLDEGELLIDGDTYLKHPKRIRQKIGCMPDKSFLIDTLTGRDFLYFHGLLLDMPRKLIKKRITDLFKLLFADPTAMHQLISQYSLGMKKRIAMCASLINSPSILVYDEPFNGLDPKGCQVFIRIIKELMSKGKKIIISSHDLEYIKDVSTHITMLDKGKVVFTGKNEEFFNSKESSLNSFLSHLSVNKHEDSSVPEWV